MIYPPCIISSFSTTRPPYIHSTSVQNHQHPQPILDDPKEGAQAHGHFCGPILPPDGIAVLFDSKMASSVDLTTSFPHHCGACVDVK